MDLAIVATGAFLVAAGAYAAKRPHAIRSFASERTRREDPRRAERRQRVFAYLLAAVLVGLGLSAVAMGVALA